MLHVRRALAKADLSVTAAGQRAEHFRGDGRFADVLFFPPDPIMISQSFERHVGFLLGKADEAVPADPHNTIWVPYTCARRSPLWCIIN